MKVTLNLTKLLEEGKISKEEHDKLADLSKTETKSHAFAIVVALSAVSIVIGTVGLFPEFFKALGEALLGLFGARGLHAAAIVLSALGSLVAGSGFLATLCAFAILTFLGKAGMFYSHAAYSVAIQEPGLTVVAFSVLAWVAYLASRRLNPKQMRVTIIFSRACIFIVNLAFWVGSLWGDTRGSLNISDLAFTIGWAVALVGVGLWAASKDKRWVVNTAAIFGSIHFYTQWFERLGATPGSLLTAGLIALGIMYGFRSYNRRLSKSRLACDRSNP